MQDEGGAVYGDDGCSGSTLGKPSLSATARSRLSEQTKVTLVPLAEIERTTARWQASFEYKLRVGPIRRKRPSASTRWLTSRGSTWKRDAARSDCS